MFKSWYEKLVDKSVVKTPIYDTVIAQLNSIHKDIQSILIDIKADKELLVKESCKKEMIIKTISNTLLILAISYSLFPKSEFLYHHS